MNNRVTSLITIVTLLFVSASTLGAERTVCFRLKIADDRTNCSTAGETGARLPCNAGGYVDAVGHQYQLWDKDSGSNDELIGTWYVGGPGTRCNTFEWENASYSKGERHPDVYVRYINLVNRTQYSNYIRIKAVKRGGGKHPVTSWRDGSAGDSDRYVARNCPPSTTCSIFGSGSMVPTNDRNSTRGLWIMALDSAQHALQAFGEVMDTHSELHFPGKDSCPTSCAVDRDDFHITRSRGDNGFNVAHEVGHLVQMQEFNRNSLRNDCSRNGDGHSLGSLEHESCATTEGWANYVGVTSWYEPNNSGTVPMGWGNDFETATLNFTDCADNAHNTLQVAKAFWDLDDWNQEAGAGAASSWNDDVAYSTTSIARGWRQFPNGNDNREEYESGQDGVNMRDYFVNNRRRFTAAGFFETFIQHNCLAAQTND